MMDRHTLISIQDIPVDSNVTEAMVTQAFKDADMYFCRNGLLGGNIIEGNSIKSTKPVKNGCYVATSVYGSYDCPQVWVLRRFRDERLSTTNLGKAFIKKYYLVSPALVQLFGETRWFQTITKPFLDSFVAKLKQEGVSEEPYCD